jgi:hypothetical protein
MKKIVAINVVGVCLFLSVVAGLACIPSGKAEPVKPAACDTSKCCCESCQCCCCCAGCCKK